MRSRKDNRKFVLTVEGQTEKWYFDWLQKQINASDTAGHNAIIDVRVEQNPYKFAKTVNAFSNPSITHVCDIEGKTPKDRKRLEGVLDQISKAKAISKKINYDWAYSNLSFDLWMILHKADCYGSFSDVGQYLQPLNRAFSQHFESMSVYKEQDNFNRCLSCLTLTDVFAALDRCAHIMEQNRKTAQTQVMYKKFAYYTDNPALTVCTLVQTILQECDVKRPQ